MFFVIFFITLLFIGIGFSSFHPRIDFLHPFSTYFFTLFDAITANIFLSLLGTIVLVVCMYWLLNKKRAAPFIVKLIMSIAHGAMLLILGFFVSFLSLYFLAFVQLNIYSLGIQFVPNSIGILLDEQPILTHVQNEDTPPKIVLTDGSGYKLTQAVSVASSGDDNFYGAFALSAIPSLLVAPLRLDRKFVMLDNTLIVSGMSEETLQTISPPVGYSFVRHYFWNRKIAAYPFVSLMDLREYQAYREVDAQEKMQKVEKNLAIIDGGIASASAGVDAKKEASETAKDIILHGKANRDAEYKTCLEDKTKNVTDCKLLLVSWDDKIKQAVVDEQTATQEQENLKQTLAAYQVYKAIFASQKSILQTLQLNIPHELGVFVPQKTIKIVYDKNHPPTMPDYLAILTHEYLHYASFKSEDHTFTDAFFEEALTEYFSRNIILQQLQKETNIGYPIQVKIIAEMTKLIPESEFTVLYFTKDQQGLEKALDRVYGDNFYATNHVLFESLQYSSEPTQTLSIANDIMKKIGGKPFSKKDLESTFEK